MQSVLSALVEKELALGESGKHQGCLGEPPQLLPKLAGKSPNSKKPRDILCSDIIESN